MGAVEVPKLGCRSPKLRKALNLGPRNNVNRALGHAIHFKHILNFGERQEEVWNGGVSQLGRSASINRSLDRGVQPRPASPRYLLLAV
jgi:hypothetical protein